MPKKLSLAEQKKRAARIKLVLTDSDGVLTDTGVYYSEQGEVFKRFSIRDGMGVERLRNLVGIETAIITGEESGSVKKRAEKLKLPFLYLGIKDKHACLERILQETNLQLENLAYIGDDMNDLEILHAIGEKGLTAAPSDALPAIRAIVHYVCKVPGGYGAFRDFAERLLYLRGKKSAMHP
jgi:3-deoxy-D-manno-octulosonate 8-phosphate phosphatase (KDO 8-P phosphatase)